MTNDGLRSSLLESAERIGIRIIAPAVLAAALMGVAPIGCQNSGPKPPQWALGDEGSKPAGDANGSLNETVAAFVEAEIAKREKTDAAIDAAQRGAEVATSIPIPIVQQLAGIVGGAILPAIERSRAEDKAAFAVRLAALEQRVAMSPGTTQRDAWQELMAAALTGGAAAGGFSVLGARRKAANGTNGAAQ